MANVNRKGLIYWLEQISKAIGTISGSVILYQSDWEETESGSPSYIKNKPEIPTVPTVGTIVEGTVSEGVFTPAEGAPSYADVLALIAEAPSVVYLNYSDTYDMVVSASASLIKGASGVEWEAPAGE